MMVKLLVWTSWFRESWVEKRGVKDRGLEYFCVSRVGRGDIYKGDWWGVVRRWEEELGSVVFWRFREEDF